MRDFPGGPAVKTHASTAGNAGLIPGQGTKIPHAAWHSQERKDRREEGREGGEKWKENSLIYKKHLSMLEFFIILCVCL